MYVKIFTTIDTTVTAVVSFYATILGKTILKVVTHKANIPKTFYISSNNTLLSNYCNKFTRRLISSISSKYIITKMFKRINIIIFDLSKIDTFSN